MTISYEVDRNYLYDNVYYMCVPQLYIIMLLRGGVSLKLYTDSQNLCANQIIYL
jgi:hypothetical protein